MPQVDLPQHDQMLWTQLVAIRELGHRATIAEANERVIQREGFNDDQLALLHSGGPRSEIEYRLAWSRTYLKGMGLLDNPARGVWETTAKGRECPLEEIEGLRQAFIASNRKSKNSQTQSSSSDVSGDPLSDAEDDVDSTWREQLLGELLSMNPYSFEILTTRLLRAAGFINTSVTSKSGDGGIDGVGTYRLSLVSFPVFFQCKRYRGSVGSDKVRDFRGAMAGRGDKGLLITTGTFTSDARNEATRDGAPPIDLIDGELLCELLKDHGLGVNVSTREVETVELDHEFFAAIANAAD
ncbi:MAG: restriction endonuclease [Thermoleophilaceae bacterium]|nr:restriction endonuclease [Thermoleophilaceae bacterium]